MTRSDAKHMTEFEILLEASIVETDNEREDSPAGMARMFLDGKLMGLESALALFQELKYSKLRASKLNPRQAAESNS